MDLDRLTVFLVISPAAAAFAGLSIYVFLAITEDLRSAEIPAGRLARAWRVLQFVVCAAGSVLFAALPALVIFGVVLLWCFTPPLLAAAWFLIARWSFRGMMSAAPRLPAGVEAALPLKGRWALGVVYAIAAMVTATGVLALAATLLVALAMLGTWLSPW